MADDLFQQQQQEITGISDKAQQKQLQLANHGNGQVNGTTHDPVLEKLGLILPAAHESTEQTNDIPVSIPGSAQGADAQEQQQLKPGDLCPRCGGVLVLRSTERGEFLGCSNYPDCSFVRHLPTAPVTNLAILSSTCPDCGKPLAVKHGRYGLFIGCSSYPECRYIVEKKVQSPIVCPMCHKGRIIKRQSRSGRSFYACSNYPSCDFLLPGEPVESKCPDCGFPLRYKKKVKAGIALYCPNTLCPSKRKRKKELWQPA